MIDPAHLTDAELAAWYGSGLHAPKAQRLIEEVRRLRRDLNDERVRNQHDRDLARELSRRLAEVEIHNGLAEDELEVELAAKRELIVERDALAEEAAHLRARLAEVEAGLASEAEAHRHSAAGRAAAEARLAEVKDTITAINTAAGDDRG